MTLLCLLTTPTAYAALRRQIDAAVASGAVGASGVVTEAEARALPYLQAVVREGLRMYPPVTGLGSKQVPPGGDVLNGHFVPGGTQVGTNFFGLMRSTRLWGPDADVFRPERWLEAEAAKDPARLRAMVAVVDLDFGFGKYQCLGKPIAMMELNKIFVEVSRVFPSKKEALKGSQPASQRAVCDSSISVMAFADPCGVRCFAHSFCVVTTSP